MTGTGTAGLSTDVAVPARFESWTGRLLDAAAISSGDAVLDVACGTGLVARAAAATVGARGFVAGVDLDPGRLAVAAAVSPGLTWHLTGADAIPYADGRFDAVVCRFGLMFFDDPVGCLREMLRVLAPGGRLALTVWDTLARTPAYDALARVLGRVIGPEAADRVARPFGLGDSEVVRRLFAAAGLPEPVVTSYEDTTDHPGARAMVESELSSWADAQGVSGRDVGRDSIERVVAEAEVALEEFTTPGGSLHLSMRGHLVTVRR